MMASSPSPVNKKLKLEGSDLQNCSKEELIQKIEDQLEEMSAMESKLKQKQSPNQVHIDEITNLKRVVAEASKRENVLVNRLVNKESEVAEVVTQVEELKRSQTAGLQQLRALCLDPAVALMLQQFSSQLDEANTQAKQAQDELQAWKFTPDSQTGKRLIARCRQLLTENDELGVIISSGRTAQLEGDAALQKQLVGDMRHGQRELESVISEMDEDAEALQSTVYKLQHELQSARQYVSQLTSERQQLTERLAQMSVSEVRTTHGAEHRTEPYTDTEPQSTQQGVCSPSSPTTGDLGSPVAGSPTPNCSREPSPEPSEQRHTNGVSTASVQPDAETWTQADTSWSGVPTSSGNEHLSNGDVEMESPIASPDPEPLPSDSHRGKGCADVEADSTGDAPRTSVQ